jgi:hypothetical protein
MQVEVHGRKVDLQEGGKAFQRLACYILRQDKILSRTGSPNHEPFLRKSLAFAKRHDRILFRQCFDIDPAVEDEFVSPSNLISGCDEHIGS